MKQITLARGFVTNGKHEIAKKGLALPNPHGGGNRDWPPGISFGFWNVENRSTAESIAINRLSRESKKIPGVGLITLSEQKFSQFRGKIMGVRREMVGKRFPREEIIWSSIVLFEDIYNYWEFTILPSCLTPEWLLRLEAEIGIGDREGNFTYQPFDILRTNVEGQPFWRRFFRR